MLKVLGSLWAVYVTSLVSIVLTGAMALDRADRLLIVILMFWGIIGMSFAIVNAKGWDRANTDADKALHGWAEQEALTMDLTHLLGESLKHLSTWDRETSDDIAERTNTIIRLRFQNFNERNHP